MTQGVSSQANHLFELDDALVACPYPTFAGLQSTSPIKWFDIPEAYVVTDYDLIVEVLRQPDVFSSRQATGPKAEREMMELTMELALEDPEVGDLVGQMAISPPVPVLLTADPPHHQRQRALVNRVFTPGEIRKLEPEIKRVAQSLIDRFADAGRVEFLSAFGHPLPMTIIGKALGVHLDRMDDFMRWSEVIVSGIGQRDMTKSLLKDVLAARTELADYLMSVVVERELEPQDDLISRLVTSEIDGERLTKLEVVNMAVQFLLAGNDTTAKLMASAMLWLAGHPEFADSLREDPSLVEGFVEEILRTQPPINGTYRVADREYVLGGVSIPVGSSLWLVYAAGNRDAQRFEEPDEVHCPVDWKSPHLTFGFGAHFCLGASLARAEARLSLQALLERLDQIEVDPDAEPFRWDSSFMLHGLQRLPLTFKALDRHDER